MVLNIPYGKNKRLKKIIELVKKNKEISQYWENANVIAVDRMKINDHGKVHAAIVSNIALKMLRLLMRSGLEPNIVKEHAMKEEDAEVVVVLAGLLHDIGHAIHRKDHAKFSIVLAPNVLDSILKNVYNDIRKRTIVKTEVLHAIISHHVDYKPLTLEAGCVRVADSLDTKEGRARIPFELGRMSIHSVSALAIKDVNIRKGEKVPISVEIVMTNPAGIFQIDELIKAKIKDSGLEKYIELRAVVKGEDKGLIKEFKL